MVGRPNAGKSSIVNAFIGEERNIVTEIAGTTRDSIYTRYNKFGFDFYLVDTAGSIKERSERGSGVLFCSSFYSCYRGSRCMYFDGGCDPWYRKSRLEYLFVDSEKLERLGGSASTNGIL